MFGGPIPGPTQDPEAYKTRVYFWIIGFTLLFVGIAFALIFMVVVISDFINFGLHYADRNIIDVFFGGFQYFGTCCLALVLFVMGAIILAVTRWGMFLDGRFWRRPYERHRHP